MANRAPMKAMLALIGITLGGVGLLLLWGKHLGEATLLACLLNWIGIGALTGISFLLRQRAQRVGQLLLPTLLRLVLLPLWVGVWAWYFSPALKPYLLVSLLGLGIFLTAEALLSLRNLRGPV